MRESIKCKGTNSEIIVNTQMILIFFRQAAMFKIVIEEEGGNHRSASLRAWMSIENTQQLK